MTDIQDNPEKLETETCSRCCGTGHYSYCQMYGTTCFKCGGSGRTWTKRGHAAFHFLNTLRSKPAADFKVGELVLCESLGKSSFKRIVAIRIKTAAEKVAAGYRSVVDGVEQPQHDSLIIECDGYATEVAPDAVMRRGLTAEEKAETMRQAIQFQNTLTKAGKPRKALAMAAKAGA